MNEDDALKRLSIWFKQFGFIVLQNQKNDNENQLFHIKGDSKERLDLIAIPKIPNHILGIEVKSGEDSRKLGVYSGIVTYYENYNNGKTLYFDEKNNQILINYFVIGTYYSPDGRLKSFEHLHIDSPRGSKPGWTRLDAVDHGCCPKIEYTTTFDITRHGIWFNIDNEKNRRYDTGIGTLLSTVLDGNGCHPGIHIKRPENVFKNGTFKRYWRTKWIPF